MSDGISYRNSEDILDFKDKFGYEDNKECRRVYEGCRKAWEESQVLGLDIYELADYLREKYDI